MIKKEENTRNPPLARMAKVILTEEAHRVIEDPTGEILGKAILPENASLMIGDPLAEIDLKDNKNKETRGKDYAR